MNIYTCAKRRSTTQGGGLGFARYVTTRHDLSHQESLPYSALPAMVIYYGSFRLFIDIIDYVTGIGNERMICVLARTVIAERLLGIYCMNNYCKF